MPAPRRLHTAPTPTHTHAHIHTYTAIKNGSDPNQGNCGQCIHTPHTTQRPHTHAHTRHTHDIRTHVSLRNGGNQLQGMRERKKMHKRFAFAFVR